MMQPTTFVLISYVVIGKPPSSDGGANATVTTSFPGITDRIDGGPGAVAAFTGTEKHIAAIQPTTKIAMAVAGVVGSLSLLMISQP